MSRNGCNGLSWISIAILTIAIGADWERQQRRRAPKHGGTTEPKTAIEHNSGLPHSTWASQKGHRAISHSLPPNLNPAWKGRQRSAALQVPASRQMPAEELEGGNNAAAYRPELRVVRLTPKPTTATQDG